MKQTNAELHSRLKEWKNYCDALSVSIEQNENPLAGEDSPEVIKQKADRQEALDTIERIEADIKRSKEWIDAQKRKFPSATLSGLFEPTRSKANLKQHSGFICIDIDDHYELVDSNGERQTYWQSLDGIDYILSQIPFVAYASHSIGGRGYFALIPLGPIDEQHSHEWYFDCLKAEFERYNIVIDTACRDVTRLRFISYDANPYRNFNAVPYTGEVQFVSRNERKRRSEEEQRKLNEILARRNNRLRYQSDPGSDYEHLLWCCEEMQRRGVYILQYADQDVKDYDAWVSVGMALASCLGEQGRDIFHMISAQEHDKYSASDTDKKYNALLRRGSSADKKQPELASVFHYFHKAEIFWWKLKH